MPHLPGNGSFGFNLHHKSNLPCRRFNSKASRCNLDCSFRKRLRSSLFKDRINLRIPNPLYAETTLPLIRSQIFHRSNKHHSFIRIKAQQTKFRYARPFHHIRAFTFVMFTNFSARIHRPIQPMIKNQPQFIFPIPIPDIMLVRHPVKHGAPTLCIGCRQQSSLPASTPSCP
jgi:hypothetical protein